jgi:hypothetical protein
MLLKVGTVSVETRRILTAMQKLSTLITCIILLVAINGLKAQNCNSEVIQFRETFGTGTGNAALPAGRTNYNYNGTGSLADGDYKLNKSSQGKPEWHNGTDHTGDVNGRMMVTNASFTPGEFYRDTVYGLSSKSNYAVYLYAMNVNTVGTCSPNPILPRLQLVIESYNADGTFTELNSIISQDLPQTATPTWVMITGIVYLPTDVTAVRYRIINNATGGCGNDIAIDDITFSQCAPQILPLSGLNLKAYRETSGVSLNWSARNEIDNERFNVEKSVDGRNWTLMTSVLSKGNNSATQNYEVKDAAAADGPVYYRIAARSRSGSIMYSNVIFISPATNMLRLTAYPNPFVDNVDIQLSLTENKPGAFIRFFDMRGKLMKTIPCNLHAGTNVLHTDGLGSFGAGLYFVDIVDRDRKTICTTRMLKR